MLAALFAGARLRPDKHERGVGLMTISGGDCTLLCDIADQEGLNLPELSPATQQVMVEALDKPTVLGNPLDVEDLQRMKPEGFDRCLEKFFAEANFDMVGVRLNLPEAITPAAEKLYTQISALSKANDKRVFVLTRASEPPAQVWYDKLNSLGLTFTGDYRKSVRAMSRLRKNERDRAIGRFQPPTRSPKVSATKSMWRRQCSVRLRSVRNPPLAAIQRGSVKWCRQTQGTMPASRAARSTSR